MGKGFIMVSKDKLESWRWRGNPNKCYVFWSLLFKANFKPEGFEKITVGKGQLVFSYDKLSVELGISLQTLRTTLKDLQETGDISIKATRRWSLLTICEYDSWQKIDVKANTQTNTQTNTNIIYNNINNLNKEEYIDNNTPYYPPSEDSVSGVTFSEFNELKKAFTVLSDENKKLREELEKAGKKKRIVFTPPTEEDVASYITEKGYHFDAASFVSFYQSKGWMVGKSKMKDWKSACVTWEKRRKENTSSLFESQPTNKDPWIPNLEKYEPAELEYIERFDAYEIPNKCPECDADWPYNPNNRLDGAKVCNGSTVWRWDASHKVWINLSWEEIQKIINRQ